MVALENSNTSTVAKQLDVKEARLAAADAVQTALGVHFTDGKTPDFMSKKNHTHRPSVSPISVTKDNAAGLHVALDQRLVDSENPLAIHTSTSTETIFVTGAAIKTHLESTGVKLTILDFSLAAV